MAKKKDEDKKIRELEERIKKLEAKKKLGGEPEISREPISIMGSVAASIIPGLGRIIETLERDSPEFKKRIENADKEISFRMERGESRKPHIHFGFSARPLIPTAGLSSAASRKNEELGPFLTLEETPPVKEEDLNVRVRGKRLLIETKDRKYHKDISLPYYGKIVETKYEKGKKKGSLFVKVERT